MEKMKLISVRIDERTLNKIDTIGQGSIYWKRSDVIRGLLAAVVDNCDRYDARHIFQKGIGYFRDCDLIIKLVPKEKDSSL